MRQSSSWKADCARMLRSIGREMRFELRAYGLRSSISSVGISVPSASAPIVSMMRLIHSICTALIGEPVAGARRDEGERERDDVDRQLELEELADVVVHAPAPVDRAHDARNWSSRMTMSARLLRDVGARDAHREPDVGDLERGRVVRAVARHADDLARARDAAARPQPLVAVAGQQRSLCSARMPSPKVRAIGPLGRVVADAACR